MKGVHEAMVELFLNPELVGHANPDATAIKGREKPAKKPSKDKPAPKERGRPANGECRVGFFAGLTKTSRSPMSLVPNRSQVLQDVESIPLLIP